jgi:F-type H+-transporting ATPase subunit a
LFLAVIVWLVYNTVGFKHNGLSYLGGMLWPRNVPVAMRPLVGLIEFLSNIILRPFSLAVRLFANMLAGHMLLVTFCLLTNALFFAETKQLLLKPMSILPFGMLLFLTAFEVLVGFLQAYIFTILTGVYIGLAAHPEH